MAVLIFSACSPFDLKMDDLEVKVDLNVIKTNVTVSFEDAATGEKIGYDGDKEIRVRFAGRDAHLIINNSGNYLTEVNTTAGLVSFGLDPYKTAPSEEQPAEIVLDVEVDGYLSTTWPVSIYREGSNMVRVLLASSVNPPKGVTVSENKDAGDSQNGVTQEEIKIETAPGEDPITIAAGTELKTADGQPLEGKLDVTIAQFDPADEEAAKAFPGGLSATVIDASGNEIKASFRSLGFMKIEIKDQNGNKAGGVPADQIAVSPKVDGSIINPNTGQPVKPGDAIPMWGLDESTGQWVFVKNVIASQPLLKSGGDSEFNMYNFGFTEYNVYVILTAELNVYSQSTDYIVSPFSWEMVEESSLQRYSGDFTYFNHYSPGTGSQGIFNRYFPVGNYYLQIVYTGVGTSPYQFSDATWVTITDTERYPTISVSYNPPPSTYTVTFNATIYCTDMGTFAQIPNGIPLRYRVKGTSAWGEATANGGNVIIGGLDMNKTYEVQALYNDDWTPSPAFEYTLSPIAGDVGNNLIRLLNFNMECN